MARPPRIEFPDAIYHVTARGIERRAIVADDADRRAWLKRLKDVVDRYRWRLFCFVLMDNHFHLFVQTPEPNLSAGMHDLIGGYATYFNTRHGRPGHLFQGRFKGVLVEAEGHWLALSRYLHLNPVRGGLVDRPEQWPYSSYPGYIQVGDRYNWVDYGRVLAEFGGDTRAARRRYAAFVEQGLGRELKSPLASAMHGMALGSPKFLGTIRERLGERPPEPEMPPLEPTRASRPSIERIVAAVASHFACDPAAWKYGTRCDSLARAVAAYLARQNSGLRTAAIARSLGYRATSSVTMACRRVEKTLCEDELSEAIRTIEDALGVAHSIVNSERGG